MTRNSETVPQFRIKHEFIKNLFFLSVITKSDNLDPNIRNSGSINIFKNNILKFIQSKPNSIFDCHNLKGIKLSTRLRFGFTHIREHKFKHSFQDRLTPICTCGNERWVVGVARCVLQIHLFLYYF